MQGSVSPTKMIQRFAHHKGDELTLSHRVLRALFLALLIALCSVPISLNARESQEPQTIPYKDLPPEAHTTLKLIRQGGPFPFTKDGTVFGNRERRLPLKPRGYYREYTVITPGAKNRGARRIVAGGSSEFYYTADHYDTFQLIVGAP